MKKYTKGIITSLLIAMGFGALSVGSTFALFTSKDESTIEVASGKINVSAAFEGLQTYSALADVNGELVDENGNKYKSTATETEGVFTNTGTATYSNGVLSLERMTPGDRVTFNLTPSLGDTNVKIKLRFSIVADSNNLDLAGALTFKIQKGDETPVSISGLTYYASDWVLIDPASVTELDKLHFDISMPIDIGNAYQDKATSYAISVEAVQGNAYTGA